MFTPNEARLELYRLQQAFSGVGSSYVDYIWQEREAGILRATSSDAWPFERASETANVTPIRKARAK